MLITVKVMTCIDGNTKIAEPVGGHGPPEPLIVVRGYLPSGQELITSKVVHASQRREAIRSVVEWLFIHRPGWSVEIDDSRTGQTVAA